ncbi:hypothetical protein PoB_004681900 [Plakobranchus ocellatus]|uniref:Secreted protein n=1 Tax=Plakobranchus ocellatus TaxID=259542 RepID=A0AAV4BJK5_9GAST|nr:hypothetical protein PoB_004681900 [Plakobranchus ocellatus]
MAQEFSPGPSMSVTRTKPLTTVDVLLLLLQCSLLPDLCSLLPPGPWSAPLLATGISKWPGLDAIPRDASFFGGVRASQIALKSAEILRPNIRVQSRRLYRRVSLMGP